MIEQPPHVEPPKPLADGEPNGNGSVHIIHETRPRLGLPRLGSPRRRRPMGLAIFGTISVIAILALVLR